MDKGKPMEVRLSNMNAAKGESEYRGERSESERERAMNEGLKNVRVAVGNRMAKRKERKKERKRDKDAGPMMVIAKRAKLGERKRERDRRRG